MRTSRLRQYRHRQRQPHGGRFTANPDSIAVGPSWNGLPISWSLTIANDATTEGTETIGLFDCARPRRYLGHHGGQGLGHGHDLRYVGGGELGSGITGTPTISGVAGVKGNRLTVNPAP
jgi:hypothetical protein